MWSGLFCLADGLLNAISTSSPSKRKESNNNKKLQGNIHASPAELVLFTFVTFFPVLFQSILKPATNKGRKWEVWLYTESKRRQWCPACMSLLGKLMTVSRKI